MARKKQFKAESKRLLDLMIHSIYTNKDIFLRELLSNASDAEDKLYFKSLEDTSLAVNRDDLKIELEIDEEKRTLTVSDNGIGMSQEELENYLGTIARSDSHDFKQAVEEDVDVIGQFGVGFYSAFMVSSHVEVVSRAFGSDKAYRFISNGIDGYSISEAEKATHGTDVILTILEKDENTDYDVYLQKYKIIELVKTYSDYIRYPILLEGETLNSMIPIWKRSKQDLQAEDLDNFYMEKFHDYEAPLHTIRMQIEGNPSFDSLLYIPAHAPVNFYSSQYEPGLQLYSRGVFIMEHNTALLPEHFRFVRGLIDSPDLSLNISREILQHDRQVHNIASRIEKKIQAELEKMLKNDREKYEQFWEAFGLTLKYGAYVEFGAHKEQLQDLLLYRSSRGEGLISLAEYLETKIESQDAIYYVSGENVAKCASLPQTEYVTSKGLEVLYLTDDIDEFVLQILGSYHDVSFKSVNDKDLNLEDEAETETLKQQQAEAQDLLTALHDELKDSVDEVSLSTRLSNHPVGLASEAGLSFEMEKVLNSMPDANQDIKAKRILQINPNHPLFESLEAIYQKDPSELHDIAYLLYNQACLIEGLAIENPVMFSQKLADLMVKTA